MKNLKGAKVLSREEQRTINGGNYDSQSECEVACYTDCIQIFIPDGGGLISARPEWICVPFQVNHK